MPHIRHSDPRTWTSSAASPAFRACCDHSSVFSESIIAPSLLACDFGNLALEAHRVIDAGADWLHVDVMDGHFVPNMAIGIPVIESLRSHTDAFFDCHMMVSDPDCWVDDMHRIGASQYTFHIEATETPRELIKKIRNRGMCPAVGIKPNTPVQSIMNLVDEVDMVLVMTVEPGFGGQAFMPDMMSKVKELRSQFPTLRIQVDGGINAETAKVAASAGANVLVAGSSLFKLGSLMQKKALIAEMRSYVQGAGQGSHC